MKRLKLKVLSLLFLAGALLSLYLPVFSVSGQRILRGYQVLELSNFGILTVLAIFLLFFITLCPLPWYLQRIMLLIVLIEGTLCYVGAAWFALTWLQWNGSVFIRHHFGLVVYPQILLGAVVAVWRQTGRNHV